MKLDISIDLQGIFDNQNLQAYQDGEEGTCGDEGYRLSDHVRQEVIQAITEKVSTDCIDAVMRKANKHIDEVLGRAIANATAAINNKALEFAGQWLDSGQIKITDKYGKETKTTTIQEIIEKGYEDALNCKVDQNGKFTTCTYDQKMSFIEYKSESRIKKLIESQMPDLNRKLGKLIRDTLDAHSSKLLTANIAKILDHKK